MRTIIIFLLINLAILYLLFRPETLERGINTLEEYLDEQSGEAVVLPEGVEVVVQDLGIPWDIAFLPNEILITQRGGNLLRFSEGEKSVIAQLPLEARGEGGLLGIALHPEFVDTQYLYLYVTYRSAGGTTENRVERYRYAEGVLSEQTTILSDIPGALFHNGGRLAFGPDEKLYITTGDAQKPALAQDRASLAGKILRVNDDGSVPADNPFPGSPVYSYGHRNPQGIAWDEEEVLWSTEHGRSGFSSGFDEINRIVPGGNYGWPESQGDESAEGTIAPVRHSGAQVTWAPASAVFVNGHLFFGGLRGETLYEAVFEGESIVEIQEHYKGAFGRIRTVLLGPDNMLYLTTSNRDGRGIARPGDDAVVRIRI